MYRWSREHFSLSESARQNERRIDHERCDILAEMGLQYQRGCGACERAFEMVAVCVLLVQLLAFLVGASGERDLASFFGHGSRGEFDYGRRIGQQLICLRF